MKKAMQFSMARYVNNCDYLDFGFLRGATSVDPMEE